ncbi:Serine/arginine-rich splicing factor 7 [Auxenochlorella protothecoides]|uniref:Serine/arginine-rich splicing factor 7 n=1 Tax=Auxenochlorella protothecoides TaxID=3075 RepID=A0A087SRJ9_AUXPR|nr:Serine/arginine-rich splicing factor 7 [Auxenochlorella protothecoides]KFM28353.1 Serine/arginine-rich splicing factor 7 [Auxenochlorella protothecoides]RMZ53666.1 hypothetical protein APUTEX25_003200 [Auxenochlorella protothecoides]|eukprot:RMZ53666.1 hypothetical protein APUTEX25_003200 [Auxenochlorella protothecoides]
MSRDAPPGTKVYVGNLEPDTQESVLSDEFSKYGRISSCWLARNPSGFAFVQFEDPRDAEDAVTGLAGKNGWRVEVARPPRARDDRFGGGPPGGGDRRDYERRDDRDRRERSPVPERRRERSPAGERDRRDRSPPAAVDRDRRGSPEY